MSILINILILILIILNTASADLPLGTRCLTKNNLSGICIKIMECKPVMDQISAGTVRANPPTVCSQTERTVCCPISGAVTKTSTTTMRTTTTERPMRISERKCREYAKSTQKAVKSLAILGENPNEFVVDKCKRGSVSLIVGGTEASLYEFPHQALLGYNVGDPGEWGCGGSLISPKFVLTAAHCLYPRSFGAVKFVKLGMHSRSENSSNVVIYGVEEIFQHPNYNTKTFNEDIGLLRLNASVAINEFILPICLPSKLHDNPKAIASGLGRTGFGQAASEKLLKVTLEKFTHEECQQAFGKAVVVANGTMLCYGHHTENKDACSGDSGGPLQISNDDNVKCTYTQIGVVSFGMKQCGTAGIPGVYVNVYYYLNWIEGIVWKDEK